MPPSARGSKGTTMPLPLKVDPAAIQARYVPEVRGMPRYRHFQGSRDHLDSTGGNIDKVDFQPSLPCLIQPARQYRVLRDEMGNNVNDMQPGVSAAIFVRKRRVKRSKEILPSLKPAPKKTDNNDNENIRDYVERKTRIAPSNSTSSEASMKSYNGVRLADSLSTINQKKDVVENGLNGINGSDGLDDSSDAQSLSVTLPQRSKSAQEIQTDPFPELQGVASTSTYSLRETKDSATQTITIKQVGFVDQVIAIGTQTESIPLMATPRRRKSETYYCKQMMEERGALMEVIEDALDETIDKYSRLRTNQIIASSARKQAQIWRDAKDFITTQLLPQSVQLANQSKTKKKTAAEIVANIRIYP